MIQEHLIKPLVLAYVGMMNKVAVEILKLKNPERAELSQRFFKTGKGQYGEGDVFLGLSVPEQRKIAKSNLNVSFSEIEELLYSKYHEFRLTGLLTLTYQYEKKKKGPKSNRRFLH